MFIQLNHWFLTCFSVFVYRVAPKTKDPSAYYTNGCMCTEVELDSLTGEYQVNRLDVLYDCGESMSPFVGQY